MLYGRTREARFLRFAEHLVASTEREPKLRTLSALLEGTDVTVPGRGKAYELMSNLLGYIQLYRFTGKAEYLKGAVAAWERIRRDHLYEAGGPWTSKYSGNGSECFAEARFFDPENVVETCSTVTWVHLSLALLRVTGEARYAAEAERAIVNQLLGAQSPDGVSWATHPPANGGSRDFSTRLSCCASNGPRALEMFARHLAGQFEGAVSVASYVPFRGAIKYGHVTVTGDYPFSGEAHIRFDLTRPAEFALDLRVPAGAGSMQALIAGRRQKLVAQPSGFLRLQRTWKSGDTVVVHADLPIERHVHLDRFGNTWVLYTKGPVVLARTVKDSREFLQGQLPKPEDLIPYYRAGRQGGGYQSYFHSGELKGVPR